MVRNIFYIGKTAKIDHNISNNREIIDVLRYGCTVFIVFNIPIHY